MTEIAFLADFVLGHPDAGVMFVLTLYLAYEIRFGRLKQVQEEQREASKERRILGIMLYKVVRDDPNFDEEEFRQLLWGKGDDEIFLNDLSKDVGSRKKVKGD